MFLINCQYFEISHQAKTRSKNFRTLFYNLSNLVGSPRCRQIFAETPVQYKYIAIVSHGIDKSHLTTIVLWPPFLIKSLFLAVMIQVSLIIIESLHAKEHHTARKKCCI